MNFIFLQSSIINDDRWSQKKWRSSALYWRSCALRHKLHSQHRHDVVHWFFHFFVSSRTRTYSCRYGLRAQKNKIKVCTFWNESEWKRSRCAQKLHYQIAHTKRLYISTHYEDIFIFQPSKSNGRKRTCLYVFSFCPPNRICVWSLSFDIYTPLGLIMGQALFRYWLG